MSKQRDDKGRFIAGNPGGPGRPPRPTEQQYLEKISEELTMDRWAAIVRRAIADAMQGDYQARRWLSEYTIGKPVTTIELGAADQILLKQLLSEVSTRGIDATEIFNAMLAELAAVDNEHE